jgi:hypothetical protein
MSIGLLPEYQGKLNWLCARPASCNGTVGSTSGDRRISHAASKNDFARPSADNELAYNRQVSLGDVNGDGRLDMVVTDRRQMFFVEARTKLFLNNRDGTFACKKTELSGRRLSGTEELAAGVWVVRHDTYARRPLSRLLVR